MDLEALASKLDISPTMHKYAVDRYEGIANYLDTKGIIARFYPQGSFRTGTVVRPLKNGIESNFDIDEICELTIAKEDTTPADIKKIIGNALKESKEYAGKLLPEEDRCWTLEYAELTDGIGLVLDIVPAVHEDQTAIIGVVAQNVPFNYAQVAVSITDKQKNSSYEWLPSNPDGFGLWFDDINRRFLEANIKERKREYFNKNRSLFRADATVDDVPDYYIRSSLQRVIQLLKRHRDLYFNRNKLYSQYRPASVIITSLVAKIADNAPSTDLESLLSYVVMGLQDYAILLEGKRPQARFDGEVRNYIEKKEQKWKIPNPVAPDDNYADSWTDDTAQAFFSWVRTVAIDLANTSIQQEQQYLAGLQTSFGRDFVTKALPIPVSAGGYSKAQTISRPTKPWAHVKND